MGNLNILRYSIFNKNFGGILMSERFNIKDLITVGIFSVMLTVVIFIFGMLGFIPGIMVALPIVIALV